MLLVLNLKILTFQGFVEMYDINNDEYELTNIIDQVLPSIKHWYKLTLTELLTCKGYKNCDKPLEHPKVYG